MKKLFLCLSVVLLSACTKENKQTELWIYTSLYKDTIAEIQPQLEKQFPDIKFNFYQAGSEEVAAKVNSENLAGEIKADVLISSDRFWYEDLAAQGKLHAYKPQGSEPVSNDLKHSEGFYTTVSIPVMVLMYNNEMIPDDKAPKTFKELVDTKWKGKFTGGSPLSSGTNFTTVAFLQKAYGWDYFKSLKKNDTICEGGNGAVVRRIQNKERAAGWVLLENVLRFQDTDKRLKFVIPEDGSIIQNNVAAIVKKVSSREAAQKFVDWMFSKAGQQAMVNSFMYSPMPDHVPPKGAPELKKILAQAKPWTPETLSDFMKNRESIKEQFTQIMYQ